MAPQKGADIQSLKKNILPILIIFLIYLTGVINTFWFMLKNNLAVVPGDLGDARFVALVLEHNFQYFFGQPFGEFWSPLWMFFPQPYTLAMSDAMSGALPLYAPWRLVGMDMLTSMQLFNFSAATANFISAFALARVFNISRIGSALAAYLFAFAMPRTGFLNHPQLAAHWWTPLVFIGLLKSWNYLTLADNWRSYIYAALAGFALAAQFWSAFYLGWFLCVGLLAIGIIGSIYLLVRKIPIRVAHAIAAAIFSCGFLALVSPLAIKYLHTAKIIGDRDPLVIFFSLPTINSWFLPTESSAFYKSLFQTNLPYHPIYGEFLMFPGFIPLGTFFVMTLLAIYRPRNVTPGKFILCAALLAIIILTLRFNEKNSYWTHLMPFIPGAKAIRAMGRIVLPLLLGFGLIAGFSFDGLHLIKNKYARKILPGLLVLLAVAEHWNYNNYGFPKSEALARISSIPTLSLESCSSFYFRGRGEPEFLTQLDAMQLAQISKIPTINGYSGGEHPKYRDFGLNTPAKVTSLQVDGWLIFWGYQSEKLCIL